MLNLCNHTYVSRCHNYVHVWDRWVGMLVVINLDQLILCNYTYFKGTLISAGTNFSEF